MKIAIALLVMVFNCVAVADVIIDCTDGRDDVKFDVQSAPPFEQGQAEVISSIIYPPSGVITDSQGNTYSTGGSNSSGSFAVQLQAVSNYYRFGFGDKYGAFDYELNFSGTLVTAGQRDWGKLMYKWHNDSQWIDQGRMMNCTSSDGF